MLCFFALNHRRLRFEFSAKPLDSVILCLIISSLWFDLSHIQYVLGWAIAYVLVRSNIAIKFNSQANLLLILLIGFIGSSTLADNLIFFSEPSHLVLFLSPLLLFEFTRERPERGKLIFFLFLLLCINVKSAIGLFLSFLLSFFLFKVALVLPITVSVILAANSIFDSYYLERFNISQESDNISVLVLLQGYEIIQSVFADRHVFGAGPTGMRDFMTGESSQKLQQIYGNLKHTEDGGIALAHGVVYYGLLYILFLLLLFRRLFEPGRRAIHIIVPVLFELLLRGLGLFSLNMLIACLKKE